MATSGYEGCADEQRSVDCFDITSSSSSSLAKQRKYQSVSITLDVILMLAEYLERITMEEKDVKIHLHKSTGSDVLQTVTLKLFNQAGSRHVTVVYP